MRVLAVDCGRKRIGLAITDPLGLTAQGLPTLERTRIREDLRTLASLAHQLEAVLILVGEPVNMDGSEGPAAEGARAFAQRLQDVSGIPVQMWDERLTSVAAHEILDEARVPHASRKGAVDRLAAVLLLESYLESNPA
jgi:putative Holliday junction resolvase